MLQTSREAGEHLLTCCCAFANARLARLFCMWLLAKHIGENRVYGLKRVPVALACGRRLSMVKRGLRCLLYTVCLFLLSLLVVGLCRTLS